MGLISKAIMAGGAFYAYKQVTKSQERRNNQENSQREMDPNQSRDQGDYDAAQEGNQQSSGGSLDGLVQLAQDFMGKNH